MELKQEKPDTKLCNIFIGQLKFLEIKDKKPLLW
jgi:hypothetical protein